MQSAVAEVAPLGVGVAISPFPIVAVILMLLTSRAKSNAPAFLAGWVVGLVAVGVIVLLISGGSDIATFDEDSTAASWVRLAIGALLIPLAWRHWRRRPRDGEEPETPRWMRQMDWVNPALALGLGLLLAGVNPKDTTLAVVAAVAIAQAELNAGESAMTLAVFVGIASVTVAAPVSVYFALGDRAEATLTGWKSWLTRNDAVVMAALFAIFAVALVAQGARGVMG